MRAEEELQNVARYIVANPLRAGLVKRIGDYPSNLVHGPLLRFELKT